MPSLLDASSSLSAAVLWEGKRGDLLAAAGQYRDRVTPQPDALVFGRTATPVRSDRRGVRPRDAPFTELVQVTQPRDLINEGFLVGAHVYSAATPDLERLRIDPKTRHGDRQQWQRHARGLRTVAFCVSRAHGRAVTAAYRSAGVAAAYVDGMTSQKTRTAELDRLRRGEVTVLVNVDVFTEGGDEPLIGCVQVLRPTLSVGRWI